jgi:hypothetical protein
VKIFNLDIGETNKRKLVGLTLIYFNTFTDLMNFFFENVCVWEYFQNYEMRLISSLSTNQKENMENVFESRIEDFYAALKLDNHFFN